MKRLILGATILSLMLAISGCANEEDKYIGKYSVGKGILELNTAGKCSYANLSCKWNAENKEIVLNTGKEDIALKILSLKDDILTIFNSTKGTKDKMFKTMGTHWNQIVGDYKCPGFWKKIKLNNDGSFEGGPANGKWAIIDENTIKLYPDRGNKVKWNYKDNQLFFQGNSICQK